MARSTDPPSDSGPRRRRARDDRRRARVKHKLREAQPWRDEAWIAEEADRKLRAERAEHPDAVRWFDRTAPSSRAPVRDDLFEHVEVHAIRSLPEAQRLAARLATAPTGRPTDRRMAIALIERLFYGEGRKEIKCHHQDLKTRNELLRWAYDWSKNRTENP